MTRFVLPVSLTILALGCTSMAAGSETHYTDISAGEAHSCAVRDDGDVVCWGRNAFGESEAPAGPFTQVLAVRQYSCGLRPDGSVDCWGELRHGENAHIEGPFTQIDGYSYTICGRKADGTAECWGPSVAFDQKLTGVTQVSGGESHRCAVVDDGRVHCLGRFDSGDAWAPDGRFAEVAGGYMFSCGLREGGALECWGSTPRAQNAVPPGSYVQVSAGWNHACAVAQDGQIQCWGDDTQGKATPPPGMFVEVDCGFAHTCGLLQDGGLTCWGDDTHGQSTPISGSHRNPDTRAAWEDAVWASLDEHLTKQFMGRHLMCRSRPDYAGTVKITWTVDLQGMARGAVEESPSSETARPGNRPGRCRLPPSDKEYVVRCSWSVLPEEQESCSIHCEGLFSGESGEREAVHDVVVDVLARPLTPVLPTTETWPVPGRDLPPVQGIRSTTPGERCKEGASPPDGRFAAVTVAIDGHTWGLRSDGSIVAWGDCFADDPIVPAGTFKAIAGGDSFACAIGDDEALTCWGDGEYGRATPPEGRFVQLSLARSHGCAVDDQGSIHCWGKESLAASPPTGSFVQVETAELLTCAINDAGTILCWGTERAGEGAMREGSYTNLSLGHRSTCGITAAGEINCWGDPRYGSTTPPAGNYRSLGETTGLACAVKDSGGVSCWGCGNQRHTSEGCWIPDGNFLQVSSGIEHSCAVTEEGDVVCWDHRGGAW